MGREQVIAKYPLRAITQAPDARSILALLAAMPAVSIDPIFRFSDYRDLLPLFSVGGTMKFSGALTLIFLQAIVPFYLILLLPKLLRTVALPLSVFVVVVRFSYRPTPAQFLASTDLNLPKMSRQEGRQNRRRLVFRKVIWER
jgi:hypothetical protein